MTDMTSTISPFTPAVIKDVQARLVGTDVEVQLKREAAGASSLPTAGLSLSSVVDLEEPAVHTNPQKLHKLVDQLTQLMTGEFNKGKAQAFLSGLESKLPVAVRDAELEALINKALGSLEKPGADAKEVATAFDQVKRAFTSKLDASVNSNEKDRSISLMVQMLILLLKMAIDSRETNKQLRDLNVRAVVATITAQAEQLRVQAIATAVTAAVTFVISIASAVMTFKSAAYSKAAAKEGVNLRNQNKQLEQTQKIASRSTGEGKAKLEQDIINQKGSIADSASIKDALVNKAHTGSATANAVAAGAQSVNAASGSANAFVDSTRKEEEAETQKAQNEQTKSSENRDYFEKLLAQILEMLKQILGSEAQIFKNLSSR